VFEGQSCRAGSNNDLFSFTLKNVKRGSHR
jgi:hypothetical protein